jgi:putative N6-adenine-specific DNA methylase
MPVNSLFAVTAPGLQDLCAFELRELDLLADTPVAEPDAAVVPAARVETGGVAFSGDLDAIYRANLKLRTCSRVLLRLDQTYIAAFSELRRKIRRIDWSLYLRAEQPVAIRVISHKSKLFHSDDVADRVAQAIADRIGGPLRREKPADEESTNPPQLIVLRLINNQCSINIDTSGELLHRRGYRQAVAKAPLRETLAAAMLLACEWDGESPLLDPFCGSGAIAIEAALMAAGLAPGRQRRFAFMDWPSFDAERWQSLLAQSQPIRAAMPTIIASDRDAGAIRMARENAERAGVAQHIEFVCQALSALQPPRPSPGWLVTNPPYGKRISAGADLRDLYAQLGNVLRAKCHHWHVGILCSDPNLLAQTKLPLDTSFTMATGGIKVRLGRGIVTAADHANVGRTSEA